MRVRTYSMRGGVGGAIAVPRVVLPAPRDVSAPRGLEAADLLGRAVIVVLFGLMAMRLGANFLETGRLTGLLLLASEMLVVILTVLRRAAITVDRSWGARIITGLSLAGPPLVRPELTAGLLPELITAIVSAFGLMIVVGGKLSLGRSFGLMPANRGIVSTGCYRFVRHPIYAGYLVTHVAFLAAHPTMWNVIVLLLADVSLMVRAVCEERVLVNDREYARYREKVRWRVAPGVL